MRALLRFAGCLAGIPLLCFVSCSNGTATRPTTGNPSTWELVVVNGSGGGRYEEGTPVLVRADVAPTGTEFDRWTGDTALLATETASSVEVVMPAHDVRLEAIYAATPPPPPSVGVHGRFDLLLRGPSSTATGLPNPFDMEVTVTFTGPSGITFALPAHYAGDGAGGGDGDLWRCYFTPDEAGEWTWATGSAVPALDGESGTFQVGSLAGEGFRSRGMLRHAAGTRHLRTADGRRWLKAGVDSPEDFLGDGVDVGTTHLERVAVVDQLAATGANSIYVMLHNVNGDFDNVWPWLGSTSAEARANGVSPARYDIARLEGWLRIFEYLNGRGIVVHAVLEDDDAWAEFDRESYYRHMVSWFGHLPGLYWNIGEEYDENYSLQDARDHASLLAGIDPFDHPIAVHGPGGGGRGWNTSAEYAGETAFTMSSIQDESTQTVGAGDLNRDAQAAFDAITDSGHLVPVSMDEGDSHATGERVKHRRSYWESVCGGAVYWESYLVPVYAGTNEYDDYAEHLGDIARGRAFLEDKVTWWLMAPDNSLVSAPSANVYCLALAGTQYLIYLDARDDVVLDLSEETGTYSVEWLDPATGATASGDAIAGGGARTIPVPGSFPDDAVCLVTRE